MQRQIIILSCLFILLFSCSNKEKIPVITESNSTLITFDEFSKTVKTGDIILFHGNTGFNKGTSLFEGGNPWAHVGMVINTPHMKQPVFWESTVKEKVKDIALDKDKDGPMLDYLEVRLKNDLITAENCNWALRRLHVADSLRPTMRDSLAVIINEVHNKHLPGAVGVIVEGLIGKYLHINTGDKKVFCSQLMAMTFKKMGLWETKIPSNGFDPADFSNVGKLPFIPEVYLHKEVAFKPIFTKDSTLMIRIEK